MRDDDLDFITGYVSGRLLNRGELYGSRVFDEDAYIKKIAA